MTNYETHKCEFRPFPCRDTDRCMLEIMILDCLLCLTRVIDNTQHSFSSYFLLHCQSVTSHKIYAQFGGNTFWRHTWFASCKQVHTIICVPLVLYIWYKGTRDQRHKTEGFECLYGYSGIAFSSNFEHICCCCGQIKLTNAYTIETETCTF